MTTNTTRSSYARLFDNGSNMELSNQIGHILTHFQSETIKQGNLLEDFICKFINEETPLNVFKEPKGWYKSQPDLNHIFENKQIINKCFIPKTYMDKENIPCGNKTGTELDFVLINSDNSITLVEMKAGKDFDTKKSKGEVDSLMNIKILLEKNGITVNELLFVSYEAKTSSDISIKTDLKDCSKITFLSFLKRIFNDEVAHEGRLYINNLFQEQANNHITYFKNAITKVIIEL